MTRLNAVVVDDSEADRYLAHRLLSRSGFVEDVIEFRDGLEAREFLAIPGAFEARCGPHPPPTLFLIDINMPRMNGFGLLESMVELRKAGTLDMEGACVVLILTSSDYSGDRERAMQYGIVDEYLKKPIDRRALEAVIERHFPGGLSGVAVS